MPTTTTTTIEIARDKGWGARIKVRVARTAAAEAAALRFLRRTCPDYVPGENYHVPSILESETDDGPIGQEIMDYFFPTCEHGMSAQLCAGPGHYPTD